MNDMTSGSRIPGFYKLDIEARRQKVSELSGVELESIEKALAKGGLAPATADKIVENVLGTYGLPFGVALNVRINGIDRLVPMVVEEPSVVAAASNAAKMVRRAGGFAAEMVESLMTTQVELRNVSDPAHAIRALEDANEELLSLAADAVPGLVERGGGPHAIEVRDLGNGIVVVHVLVDCRDAMGANLVNSVAEAVGPRAAELTGATLGLRILSNLCDRRRVRVTCRAHAADLELPADASCEGIHGDAIIDRIVDASRFAELDPYRAATHNKGIMNGVDAVVMATGNDWRAVEAGAHAYAARSGHYAPLAIWRRDGRDLVGELEMPLALGVVGGTLRVHPAARLALSILQIETAAELSETAAAMGLASNLAALRALATEGIQRGHMSLHARAVAAAAGAEGDEVETVAQRIAEDGNVTLDRAAEALAALRGQ
ncbi:MAG: hydroxymethylglutaryl-CoA reductase, degradative [Myxococcales bacterium]|nr:hydroxymethylglutaryl-CoA reductase, degradative [Myxococcales bacterium]MCB9578066.1 hydroxymethylglutaryl-CoA reductase, degradative [Polyangiaceae bacterium]